MELNAKNSARLSAWLSFRTLDGSQRAIVDMALTCIHPLLMYAALFKQQSRFLSRLPFFKSLTERPTVASNITSPDFQHHSLKHDNPQLQHRSLSFRFKVTQERHRRNSRWHDRRRRSRSSRCGGRILRPAAPTPTREHPDGPGYISISRARARRRNPQPDLSIRSRSLV